MQTKIEIEYLEILGKIYDINRYLKSINKKPKSVRLLIRRVAKSELRNLKEKQSSLLQQLKQHSYLIDLTVMSVVGLSAKKSRYLRDTKGIYHNDIAFLVAKKGDRMFAYKTKYSQILAKELNQFKAILHNITKESVSFLTDNRHRFAITVSKHTTMEIERVFSRLKKPIYAELKRRQYWKNGLLITNITIEDLFEIYFKRMKELNILGVNF